MSIRNNILELGKNAKKASVDIPMDKHIERSEIIDFSE